MAAAAAAEAGDSELRYVPALTSPFFNESPYIMTESRSIYMLNLIPDSFLSAPFANVGGGVANIVTMQARYAFNDRLAFIMTKNGYAHVDLDESLGGALPDDGGPLNVAFGAKYAVIAKPERANYLTFGGRYEVPVGNLKTGAVRWQGGGKGFFDMFASYGTLVGKKTGFQTSTGFDFALDGEDDASLFHYSVHVDHQIFDRVFGVLEANVVHTLWQGERTPQDPGVIFDEPFEGQDLFNFGSRQSGTWASLGIGGRFKLNDHWMFGAAGEIPVTSEQNITEFRLTLDTIFKF